MAGPAPEDPSIPALDNAGSVIVRERVEVGPWRVAVAVGDLVDVEAADAFVSSDDNYLSHGGGVSRALWRAAGPSLNDDPAVAALRQGGNRPTVGDVIATTAGALPAESLLHAITLDFDRGVGLDADGLERLLRNLLDKVLERGAFSVALPLIGTGAAQIPVSVCTETFGRVLELHPSSQPVDIILVLVHEDDVKLAVASLQAAALARRDLVGEGLSPEPAWNGDSLPAVWAAVARRAIHAPDAARMSKEDSPIRATAERLLRGTAGDRYADARALVKWFGHSPQGQSADGDVLPPFAEVGGGEGTRATRALENLVRVAAAPDDVTSLISRLRGSGFRARSDQHVLLEYCASQDPVTLLKELFTGERLRRLLKDAGDSGGSETEGPEEVYRRALRRLGFPVTPYLVTPQGLREHVRATRVQLAHFDLSQLRGEISKVGADLELLLGMLLRFYSRDAFDSAPEALLVQSGQATHPSEVARASLGSLLGYLRWLTKEIRKRPDLRTQDVRAHLAARPLVPKVTDEIPKLRNRWAHARENEPSSLADARSDVAELCTLVDETLNHWIEGEWPIFPSVLTITEVSRDRYGRVRVTARSGDGATEILFTDIEVASGATYLARRLTNPLSVDPVLVALGSTTTEEPTNT